MLKKLVFILLLSPLALFGQQSQLLFHMHYLGQSNALNPAVQSTCKWFIGIPVLSSIHLNYANSAFSYRQLVTNRNGSASSSSIDQVVDKLGRRSLLATELHINLLSIGYKRDEYYYNFSITEKNNLSITLPKDLFSLVWEGNTQFVGDEASLKGTGLYANHYREYAFGISKEMRQNSFVGIKAKLLFGKYNASQKKINVSLETNEATYDLNLEGVIAANLSAPIYPMYDFQDIQFDPDFSLKEFILNRKNWGLAFDAGFIYPFNSKLSLSGSILDLGFIRWRTNPHNYYTMGDFTYQGVLADSMNVVEAIAESNIEISHDAYFTRLPTKLYFGGEYKLHPKLKARSLGSALVYPTKIVTAFTASADYMPFNNFHLLASYSLMYRSFNTVGFGFSIGQGPLQFYMISDNILGFIRPLSTRNLNFRFGMNINLGCSSSQDDNNAFQSTLAEECKASRQKGRDKKKRRK